MKNEFGNVKFHTKNVDKIEKASIKVVNNKSVQSSRTVAQRIPTVKFIKRGFLSPGSL